MIWTVLRVDAHCGACGATLVADEPVALLTKLQLVRCPRCVATPVDQVAVDLERWRLDQERTPAAARVAPPVSRVTPYREPVRFGDIADSLPFDPKFAALNERE